MPIYKVTAMGVASYDRDSKNVQAKDPQEARLKARKLGLHSNRLERVTKIKNPARRRARAKNPKKFKASIGGKLVHIIATSERAAEQQLKSMFGSGAKLVNPCRNPLESGDWIPAHAVRVRKGKLEIMRDS